MKLRILLLTTVAITIFSACNKDDKLNSKSIFDSNETTVKNEFDTWIDSTFTDKYNIMLNYRLDDKETDMSYNLAPADYFKSIALAQMTKYVWIDAYTEHVGEDFMKTYCPKLLQFIGSPAYNANGSIVLGTAEGGLKVVLYNVNSIDVNNIDLDVLNQWYFKTMHHEFAHILHQTVEYSTDFALITPSSYQSSSWVNLSDKEALDLGFISPYGSSEVNEDFVEFFAVYVTSTTAAWNTLIAKASAEGQSYLAAKLAIVKSYMLNTWDIDMDELREVVQRRSTDVESWTADYLTTLN